MSLDIYLIAFRETTVFDANYTHNVTPMWHRAGVYDALYMSDGKTAAEVLPELRAGLEAMRIDPEGYAAINPPNGWGSYETALPWLAALIEKFEANQDGVIRAYA